MALVEEGRAVGAVECHLDTGRGLISLGRVARTRVSVVRPETPSDSWKQHWWCVQGRASEDVSVNWNTLGAPVTTRNRLGDNHEEGGDIWRDRWRPERRQPGVERVGSPNHFFRKEEPKASYKTHKRKIPPGVPERGGRMSTPTGRTQGQRHRIKE